MTVLKKIMACITIFAIMSGCFVLNAFAAGNKIVIEGTEATLSGDILFIDGYNFAPLGEIMKLLGAEVSWEPDTKTATAARGENVVIVTIGSTSAVVNGASVTLDAAPVVINDKTYVPIGFIGRSLGYSVSWSPETKTVTLETPNAEKDRIDLSYKPRYSTDLTFEQAKTRVLMYSKDLRTLSTNIRDLKDARNNLAENYTLSVEGFSGLSPMAQIGAASAIDDSLRSSLSQLETWNISIENEKYQRETIEDAAALSVKSSFYNIVKAENTIAETNAQIELSNRTLKNNKLMLDLGMLSQTEYDKAVLTHDTLLESQGVNERALEIEYVGLNKLLGYDAAYRYNVVDEVNYEPLDKNFLIDNHVTKMMGSSPSIKISESTLREAEAELKLFSGNTMLAYNQAKSAVSTASLNLDDAKRNYEKNVRSAYTSLRNLETSIAAAELELAKNKIAADTARVQYQTGNITELQLLQQLYALDKAEKDIDISKVQHGVLKYQFETPSLISSGSVNTDK